DKRQNAEQIQAPGGIEPKEFQISREKVKQEMVTNSLAGKMRIFGWKIMPNPETLNDRRVGTEIAVLVVGDLYPPAARIQSGEHHPGHHRGEDRDQQPVDPVRTGRTRNTW